MKTSFKPLSAETWKDLETLFGPKGACGGCWCMWWKLPRKEFVANKGDKNRQLLKKEAAKKLSPGIILYEGNIPVGWCAVEPRENYPRLATARSLKPIDDQPVWSVTCFFIAKEYRGKGYSVDLLNHAKKYCRQLGAKYMEGYPYDVTSPSPPPFIYTGTVSGFKKAGYTEVARPSPTKAIVRLKL